MRLAALFMALSLSDPCMLYKLSMFFFDIFIMNIPLSDLSVSPPFYSHLAVTSANKLFNYSTSDLPVSMPPSNGTKISWFLKLAKDYPFSPDLDLSVNPIFLLKSSLIKISSGSSS